MVELCRQHIATARAASGAILAFASGGAWAQDIFAATPLDVAGKRPQPEFDQQGVHISGVKLLPSIESGVRFDSNVFSNDADRQSDGVAVVSGALNLRSLRSDRQIAASLNGSAHRYFQRTDQNRNNYRVAAGYRGEIGRSTTAFVAASYRKREAARGTVENDLGAGAPLNLRTTSISAGLEQDFGRFGLRHQTTYSRADYSDVETAEALVDQDFRDNERLSNSTTVNVDVSERLALLANGVFSRTNYTNEDSDDPSRDLTTLSGGVGFAYQISELVSSNVIVGYRTTRFSDPAYTDFDGLSVSAAVNWHPTPLLSFSLAANQDIVTSAFSEVDAVTVTRTSVTADYELLRNFLISSSVGYARETYNSLDLTANRYEGRISAQYKLNRNAAFSINATYTDRTQSSVGAPVREYDRITMSFGVRLAL